MNPAINSGRTLIIIVIVLADLYVCLAGFLFLRALIRTCTKNAAAKILPRIYWPIAILTAGVYFYLSYSSGVLRSFFSVASSYWGLLLFIPFFLLADILCFGAFIFRRAGISRSRRNGTVPEAANGKTNGMTFSLWVRAAGLVLAAGILVLGSITARYATVTPYSVTIQKPLPETAASIRTDGLRVILISDLHIGSMIHKKQLSRIVSKINTLQGDIVLIAGDINDRSMDVFKDEKLYEEFGRIKAPLGVYAVPGNHDYFGGNTEELKKYLALGGVELLVDDAVLVDNAFYVIGRSDASRRGTVRKSLDELTANLDTSLPLIVMDHQPINLGAAEAAGIDLQVSGHTHHGQIWPGPIITKRIYENDYGLLYKGKTAIVVTSGCGTWGPPIRIGTKSEIVYIDLKGK